MINNGKITIRQIYIIFILATLSPAIRVFPSRCARYANQAAWVSPIIAAIPLIILYTVLSVFFFSKKIKSINNIFVSVMGEFLGKALMIIYLIWCLILFCLYIRYYAGRLLNSIYPNTDMRFFIIVMLLLVFMAARGRIESFARCAEFLFIFFNFIFIILFLLLLPDVKLKNIYPVTPNDIVPVIKASGSISAIWGYLILPFFFGEKITNLERIKKYGKETVIYLVLVNVILILTVIGTLGPSVAQRMPLPLFNAIKLISFLETIDRFESIAITIWVAADFIIISFFAIVIINIIKKLFKISETKHLVTPVVLSGYIGSQFVALNRFELEVFTSGVAVPVNNILFFAVPIIVLITGKIRKKI